MVLVSGASLLEARAAVSITAWRVACSRARLCRLIGAATPGYLIKDGARTPFNIGHRTELTDFTCEEAEQLTRHLDVPPAQAKNLIRWILAWTGGHP